jgi:hypothetical protein
MTLSGNYPFLVYVANMFEPGLNVIFKVKCHRFLSYYDSETKNFIIETSKITEKEHSIEAGDRLAFPLYFGAEYLEISLSEDSNIPPYEYFIQAGAKAKARFILNGEEKKPKKGTYIKGIDLEDDFYAGGGWEVNEEDKDKSGTLTIKKYGADPETDDVVIGQAPPA